MGKKQKHIVSFSGGKDSTAMLLHMLHLKLPIDQIVFCDTGLELPETYLYIDLIEQVINRPITRIRTGNWDKWFFGKVTRGKHKDKQRGFPLAYFPCWHNHEAVYVPLRKICKDHQRYIGYVKDEASPVRKNIKKQYLKGNFQEGFNFPLIDWNWSGQDCKNYLKERNLLNPIYDRFDRTGCFLCPKQSKRSLESLFIYYPLHWKLLLFYNLFSKFHPAYNLLDLEREFSERARAKKERQDNA